MSLCIKIRIILYNNNWYFLLVRWKSKRATAPWRTPWPPLQQAMHHHQIGMCYLQFHSSSPSILLISLTVPFTSRCFHGPNAQSDTVATNVLRWCLVLSLFCFMCPRRARDSLFDVVYIVYLTVAFPSKLRVENHFLVSFKKIIRYRTRRRDLLTMVSYI